MAPFGISSFSGPHIPADCKTSQTTHPQTYLHLYNNTTALFHVTAKEHAIQILVFLVWVSFCTAPLPIFHSKIPNAKAVPAVSIITQSKIRKQSPGHS